VRSNLNLCRKCIELHQQLQLHLICSIKFLSYLCCLALFRHSNNIWHLRERKILLGRHGLGEIVENGITVVTAITLSAFSYHPLLDSVRTAKVRGHVAFCSNRCLWSQAHESVLGNWPHYYWLLGYQRHSGIFRYSTRLEHTHSNLECVTDGEELVVDTDDLVDRIDRLKSCWEIKSTILWLWYESSNLVTNHIQRQN
jgi:hypothetical protein